MIRALPASLAVRQGVVTALIVLATVVVFAWSALAMVDAALRRDLLHTIDTDLAGLVDVAAQGGRAELARRIADRTALAAPGSTKAYYWLAGADGRQLSGNLPRAPTIDAGRSSSATTLVGTDEVLVRATRIEGGASLVVGRSLAPTRALEHGLAHRLTAATLVALVAALLVGAVVARGVAGRVTRYNRVFHRFAGGALDARIGRARSRDELGVLAAHIDAHLDRIARLIAAQREVSDNIAHELRTPLAHLDTRLRRALDMPASDALAAELDAARADVTSIVSLFEALLDIALGQTQAPAHDWVDLSAIAADVVDLYAASAEEAGLALEPRIAPGVRIRGEPMQLTRLFSNLLDNAVKFVPAGSRVRLEVREGPVIVVEDDGDGIAPEHRARIFERFGRVDAARPGHGLGLALVKVIAARHGMTVRLEDAAPGARFVLEGGEE